MLAKASGTLRYRLMKVLVSPPQRNVAAAHCVLQGKGHVRQRSIFADLIYSQLFVVKVLMSLFRAVWFFYQEKNK